MTYGQGGYNQGYGQPQYQQGYQQNNQNYSGGYGGQGYDQQPGQGYGQYGQNFGYNGRQRGSSADTGQIAKVSYLVVGALIFVVGFIPTHEIYPIAGVLSVPIGLTLLGSIYVGLTYVNQYKGGSIALSASVPALLIVIGFILQYDQIGNTVWFIIVLIFFHTIAAAALLFLGDLKGEGSPAREKVAPTNSQAINSDYGLRPFGRSSATATAQGQAQSEGYSQTQGYTQGQAQNYQDTTASHTASYDAGATAPGASAPGASAYSDGYLGSVPQSQSGQNYQQSGSSTTEGQTGGFIPGQQ